MSDLLNQYKRINKNSVVLALWDIFWLFFSINLIKIDLDDKLFINILKFIILAIIISASVFHLKLKLKRINKFYIDNKLYNLPLLLYSTEYKNYSRIKYYSSLILISIIPLIGFNISKYYTKFILYILNLIGRII